MLSWLNLKRTPLAPSPTRVAIEDADALLAGCQDRLDSLLYESGLAPAILKPLVRRYARFVQTLPLTPALPGLTTLDYGLRLAVTALTEADVADPVWRYALLSAALIRQAGGVAASQRVSLYRRTERLGYWQPLSGPMYRTPATHYRAVATGGPPLWASNALLCHYLVPPPALAELVAAGEVLDDWLAALTLPPGESRLSQWLARGEQTLGLLPTVAVHREASVGPVVPNQPASRSATVPPVNPRDPGGVFLHWVKEQLHAGQIKVNTAQAPIQIAANGVMIATQLLRQHSALHWETTLRHLLKLKRHAKAPDGGDICHYRVGEGEVLKGIYLTDAGLLFGANVPPVNPRLRVVE